MLIIGHRGDRREFEDNTIEGIASAFKRGADGVEIDVYFRSEKGVYMVHPYLHDIKKEYPKLDEVFEIFGDKGLIQIEIKFLELDGLDCIKKLVEKHNIENYVLTSSIFPLLKHVRDVFPDGKINLLATRLIEDWWTKDFGNYFLLNYLELTGADGLDTGKQGFWTKERVSFFHNKGFRCSGHLVAATKGEWHNNSRLGLDACTADNLDILKWRK